MPFNHNRYLCRQIARVAVIGPIRPIRPIRLISIISPTPLPAPLARSIYDIQEMLTLLMYLR